VLRPVVPGGTGTESGRNLWAACESPLIWLEARTLPPLRPDGDLLGVARTALRTYRMRPGIVIFDVALRVFRHRTGSGVTIPS
jgi:hypothetical protein